VIRQFYKYLVAQGYVERVKRGEYKLSEKGETLLVILAQISA
jgi:predicted transcriptional regulator